MYMARAFSSFAVGVNNHCFHNFIVGNSEVLGKTNVCRNCSEATLKNMDDNHDKTIHNKHSSAYVCYILSLIARLMGATMGPIWGRQDPGEPHVGPMNFAIWDTFNFYWFYAYFTTLTKLLMGFIRILWIIGNVRGPSARKRLVSHIWYLNFGDWDGTTKSGQPPDHKSLFALCGIFIHIAYYIYDDSCMMYGAKIIYTRALCQVH